MIARWSVKRVVTSVCLALVLCVYCGWVSLTTPFTTAADVAVACGFAVMTMVAARALWRRLREEDRLVAAGSGRLWHWWPVASIAVGYECLTYVLGQSDRWRWPTISSLYDSAATSHGAKAAFVLLWMALGFFLFRR